MNNKKSQDVHFTVFTLCRFVGLAGLALGLVLQLFFWFMQGQLRLDVTDGLFPAGFFVLIFATIGEKKLDKKGGK